MIQLLPLQIRVLSVTRGAPIQALETLFLGQRSVVGPLARVVTSVLIRNMDAWMPKRAIMMKMLPMLMARVIDHILVVNGGVKRTISPYKGNVGGLHVGVVPSAKDDPNLQTR